MNHRHPSATSQPLTARKARRGLGIYLATVLLCSAPLYVGMVRTEPFAEPMLGVAWLAPFMLVPTMASVVARLVLHEGFGDLSRARRNPVSRRMTRRALLLPVVVGLPAYSVAAFLGLIALEASPPVMWVSLVVVSLVMNLVLATGEELGWRAYMVPRLVAADIPAPLPVSGLIWGLWHVPLYLWAGIVQDGPHPVVQTALMLTLTMALGYVLGRLQVMTGTVWAPVALHVAWNVVMQTGFGPIATGEDKHLWVGEVGVFTVLVTVIVAVGYARRPWGFDAPPRHPDPQRGRTRAEQEEKARNRMRKALIVAATRQARDEAAEVSSSGLGALEPGPSARRLRKRAVTGDGTR